VGCNRLPAARTPCTSLVSLGVAMSELARALASTSCPHVHNASAGSSQDVRSQDSRLAAQLPARRTGGQGAT